MISFIVPFRGSDPWRYRAFMYVYSHLLADYFFEPEVFVVDADPEIPFDRCRSRNLGAARATGDILVFVDADSYLPREQFDAAVQMIDGGAASWLLPYSHYLSLTEVSTRQFLTDGGKGEYEYEYVFPSVENPAPAVGGCVVVHREAFDAVHGYDERFVGWGEEDRAFQMSLDTLVHPMRRVEGPIYHFWHPADESVRFAQPDFEANRFLCDRYRSAVGNPSTMGAVVGERPLSI